MFFVFGPSGQMYRGGPEKINQVAPVRRVRRPQALRTRGAEGSDAHGAPAPAGIGLRAQDAVAAYAQTALGPQQARQPLTRVQDVMTTGAVTVRAQSRVNDAWQTLAKAQVAQAVVVDAHNRVVGLLLRADMAPLDLLPTPGAVHGATALARRLVSEVMVSPVPAVAPEAPLRRVAAVLLDTGLPGLPVADGSGALAGFISRTDILRAVAADPPLDMWS